MPATKTSKISLNIFDDKRFYVNNIKSYPHDENLYLFKRDLVNMIREQTPSVVNQRVELVENQAAAPIKKLYKDKDLRSSFANKDVDKLICEAGSMINDIKELTIDSNRKLVEAAIRLYNELSAKQLKYQGLRPFH